MLSRMSSLIAVAQMRSTSDKAANLACCTRLISKAKDAGAKAIFLPEAFDYIAESRRQSVEMAEPIDGPVVSHMRKMAKEKSIIVSLGGFHQRDESNEQKIINTHILIDENGDIIGQYAKTHLYDVNLSSGLSLSESSYVSSGSSLGSSPIPTSLGNIGLAICYDMRFPELSSLQRLRGSQVLTFPSAFTVPTGEAHWHALLRARAIENQCYVVAAAQAGRHNSKRSSYGHALVVDPWGRTLVDLDQTHEDIGLTQIDLQELQTVRDNMNVQRHRRDDLYLLAETDARESEFGSSSFAFGRHCIPASHVVFTTAHSLCLVNRKPVLPGHLLVALRRPSGHRLQDLTPSELFDVFQSVKRAEAIAERFRGASASTISVQDGKEAGQTVEQFHVHVLARLDSDFDGCNDDIYDKLEAHDKTEHGLRESKVMTEEALLMRTIMKEIDEGNHNH